MNLVQARVEGYHPTNNPQVQSSIIKPYKDLVTKQLNALMSEWDINKQCCLNILERVDIKASYDPWI